MSSVGTTNLPGAGDGSSLGHLPGSAKTGRTDLGYARGLRQLGGLSLPALALLVVFALYESFSIVYLVPLLTEG